MKDKFYITTAIAYASRKPHIGNTYEAILTDCIARFKRMQGYDVFFLTGTDEHGAKIEGLAKESGISPKEYVDGVAGEIRQLWDKMGTTYNKFIRTTDDYHERAVKNIFKKLYDQGDIYKGVYEGLYCVPCETFYTETQAVNGICPDCGRPVQKTKEEAYFLKLSKYQDRLVKHIEENPDFIAPEPRKKEMLNNFILPGLQDLCISRSTFKWGVPVPIDKKHVIYVWIDALSNYITALGYDTDKQDELYKKHWPADVHIIGKDILRFHTIVWPIILMALGEPLPKQVFGHPWINFGNDKMSKSKGNVIYAVDLAGAIRVGGVRYYVLTQVPYAADGSITYEMVAECYNADLANNLGNLVSRTLAMTKKYFGGIIPVPSAEEEVDISLKETCLTATKKAQGFLDTFHIADAGNEIFSIFKRANKYIDETAPWVLAKSEETKDRLGTVLYNLLEAIRFGAVLLAPYMPETADKILKALGCDSCDLESLTSFGKLSSGTTLGELPPLFARIDEKTFPEEMKKAAEEKANAGKMTVEAPVGLAKIGIDDFMNVELRTAQVIECKPVPKSDKLLCLMLDLGYEKRQVVSGIAKFYSPEKLIGKKVIVVANLTPAKLRGVESNGMILASGEENVRVVFLDPETPNGERVR